MVEPDKGAEAIATLREAREAHGISVDEVAHELHLSREVVLALEEGDYEALGAPVFVRGHLRSYARLVGLSEEKIVDGYQTCEPEAEEFRTLSTHSVVKPGASLPNFVLWALLVLFLLVGAGYLLLGGNESPTDVSGIDDQSANFSEPRLTEAEDAPIVITEDESSGDPDAFELVAPADTKVAGTAATPVEEKAADMEIRSSAFEVKTEKVVRETPEVIEQPAVAEVAPAILTLRFNEECWVEISDSKRRLLYGLEKPNSEVELEGVPPFKLFIGNTEAVEIEVAGRPYTIPQSGLRGANTARFSIAKESFQ